MNREKIIVRTSVIGILANVLLAGFKAAIGFFANSLPIILDAVNNLTDVLSSVVTIIGTKLSNRPADRKHPLGHGRIEYLTSVVISVIILYAGVTSLIESIKKIITPETPDYTPIGLIIIGAAVAVKIVLGIYVQRTGKRVNSDSLIASGKDALMDSIISASTLVAAGIYLIFHISLEAYLGALISLFIIKAGFDILRETVSQILGERVDSEVSQKLKLSVASLPEVYGVYDVVLHSYGPDRYVGSLHIEVDEKMSATEIDALERKIQAKVYEEFGIALTGISIYAVNMSDDETRAMYESVQEVVSQHEHILQLHGFSLDKATKTVIFDIVVSFDEKDRHGLCDKINEQLQAMHEGYTFHIVLDSDIAD